MSIDEKIRQSITHVVKAVFPSTTNHQDTLFGGQALEWMDEVAFITATRFCHQKVVTVALDKIDFKVPIPSGSLVEMIGKVEHVGRTSIRVSVNVIKEDMYSDDRVSAIHGTFTLVAVDDARRPVPVCPDLER